MIQDNISTLKTNMAKENAGLEFIAKNWYYDTRFLEEIKDNDLMEKGIKKK